MVVELEATGHWVEGHEGFAERLIEKSRVKEVEVTTCTWSVKINSGRVKVIKC